MPPPQIESGDIACDGCTRPASAPSLRDLPEGAHRASGEAVGREFGQGGQLLLISPCQARRAATRGRDGVLLSGWFGRPFLGLLLGLGLGLLRLRFGLPPCLPLPLLLLLSVGLLIVGGGLGAARAFEESARGIRAGDDRWARGSRIRRASRQASGGTRWRCRRSAVPLWWAERLLRRGLLGPRLRPSRRLRARGPGRPRWSLLRTLRSGRVPVLGRSGVPRRRSVRHRAALFSASRAIRVAAACVDADRRRGSRPSVWARCLS